MFVACNEDSLLVMVDIKNWQIVASVKIPPYAVGLALSKSGKSAIVTSQGKENKGGHVLSVVRIHY